MKCALRLCYDVKLTHPDALICKEKLALTWEIGKVVIAGRMGKDEL
ncbi:hypothetical protein HUW46_06151 [Amycolatopsis sp. CA-230715]|nr:hypothetical protein HUW46_06151 [Amycolatopsis sp. CA-230715]